MSRQIDYDKPFSDEDKEFLLTRGSMGESAIRQNELQFADLDDDEKKDFSESHDEADKQDAEEQKALEEQIEEEEIPYDDDVIDKVTPLDFNDLRAAAKKHLGDGSGTKDELIEKLLEFYQKQKDESTTVPTGG